MFASTDESTHFLMGLVATLSGCRGTRTPKGIPAPAIFKIVSSSSQITPFFLSTVVNRRTFSPSRLKDFYKSPHDSYHDYMRNNFSNLAETIGVEPIQLFSCLRFSKPSHYRSGMLPNSRHERWI